MSPYLRSGPLSYGGLTPTGKIVLDAESDGRAHLEAGNLIRMEEPRFLGFGAALDLSTQDGAAETDRELLPNLAVREGHNAARVSVDAGDPDGTNIKTRLLLH